MYSSLEPPYSTHGGDILRRSPTFSYEIQFRTTSTRSLFRCDAYFWQRRVPKRMRFPISLHYKMVRETEDEYYEMLQKISTRPVGYGLLTYFRDEVATATSRI